MATMGKGPRADFFPSPELYEDLEPWYQQRPHAYSHPRGVQKNSDEPLLVLGSPVIG